MKIKITGTVNIESEFNDNIFNDNIGGLNSLATNREYTKPMVQTWYYTNINNFDLWIKDKDIPIPVTYSNKLFSTEPLGLYIVKRYNIRYENRFKLNALLRYILTSESEHIITNKDEVAELINEHLQNTENYGEDFILRYVYFIPKSVLDYYKILETNSFLIARSLSEMSEYESTRGLKDNIKKLVIELTYKSDNNDSITFKALGTDVTLKSFGKYGNRGITVKLKNGYGDIIDYDVFQKDEFLATGLINDVVDSKYTDKIAEVGMTRIKQRAEWMKYVIEHDISLHKLNAYIVNEETAKLKLDKEEVTLYKDAFKTLKDLIP